MKNKGFTLIEVLSVIILIGILMSILIPSVIGIMDRFKQNIYDENENNLLTAAKLYLKYDKNKIDELFTEDNDFAEYNYLMVSEILQEGYIDSKILETIDYDPSLSIILIRKEKDEISYELTKLQPESCYTFNSSTNTITAYSSSCSKDVILPKTINGTPVYVMGTSAFRSKQLTSIIVPKGYTEMKSQSFDGNYIVSLDLPATMKIIGDLAFRGNLIESIKFPSSVISIGMVAFGNNRISYLELPSKLQTLSSRVFNNNLLPYSNAFLYKLISEGVYDNKVLIGYGGGETNNLLIPEGIETIDQLALDYSTFTSVTFPSTLKTIGYSSFSNGQLTAVNIPNGVTTINSEAFINNKITSISIPTSVTSIGSGAFNNNLLPPAQAFIKGRTTGGVETTTLVSYGGADRTNIVIPNGITAIANSAMRFMQCSSITLPSGLTSIGPYAFYQSSINSVNIPSTVTTIDYYAFNSSNLTSIAIPNATTNIGASAFQNNKIPQGSATIDNASGAVTIGGSAFANNGATGTTTITPVYLR